MDTPADCQMCALCCFSKSQAYVPVTGDDWTRLGARAEELAHFSGNRAYMNMQHGHCVGLRRHPGSGGYFCSIYELRPATCRNLQRGSPECLAELDRKVSLREKSADLA